ncbi:MAG: DinB family protein [Chloroflexota bacterium]
MGLKEELAQQMESTRQNFHHLLDSIPEALYVHPSDNPAWTIGDVLYHITLGPPAIRVEVWMIRHASWLFKYFLNDTTSKIFNWGNALFAQQPKRITRQSLIKAYEAGHAGLMSRLRRVREADFEKSVIYPESFVSELAGVVTIERLFRYVTLHFDVHAKQIKVARD